MQEVVVGVKKEGGEKRRSRVWKEVDGAEGAGREDCWSLPKESSGECLKKTCRLSIRSGEQTNTVRRAILGGRWKEQGDVDKKSGQGKKEVEVEVGVLKGVRVRSWHSVVCEEGQEEYDV